MQPWRLAWLPQAFGAAFGRTVAERTPAPWRAREPPDPAHRWRALKMSREVAAAKVIAAFKGVHVRSPPSPSPSRCSPLSP